MLVKLTYFRPSGKYYSSGEYTTTHVDLWQIWGEVQIKLERRQLPALREGHSKYIVLIDVPDHEHNCPHLFMP